MGLEMPTRERVTIGLWEKVGIMFLDLGEPRGERVVSGVGSKGIIGGVSIVVEPRGVVVVG